MRKLIHLVFFIFFLPMANAQQPVHFELGREHFMVNGKPFRILSGELHYARIPKPYWRQRIQMAKAMGLNTISTYVFWNYHELSPGVFDFKSENRNLAEFIKIAQEEGMFVILRPGPYVCAEWDLGGLPWWLLNIRGMELRSLNPDYQSKVLAYFKALNKEVRNLQWQFGGPIILTQVENEYGSFAAQIGETARVDSLHQNLMNNTVDQLRSAGFQGPFFTADGSSLTQYGAIAGVLPSVNGEGNPQGAIDTIKKYNYGKGPFFVAELYSGWLTHWSEKEAHVSTDSVVNDTKILLDGGVDINFYMFHGGTNFGWTSGANYNHEMAIQPDITSYDYDAPLSESGDPTPKFLAIRELLKSYQNGNQTIVEIPSRPKAIRIPLIQLSPAVALLNNLPEGIPSQRPRTMESLGQGYGWMLYRSNLKKAGKGWLKVKGLRDYAIVYADGKRVGILNRMYGLDSLMVDFKKNVQIDILVENMGRINYGKNILFENKGITEGVFINKNELTDWLQFSLPLDKPPVLNRLSPADLESPAVRIGEFELLIPGDTWLDMRGWGKGIAYINGHHLGRFWDIGPQQSLYVPGCWLKKGNNELIIIDFVHPNDNRSLQTIEHPVYYNK